jgi:hypothetical protein
MLLHFLVHEQTMAHSVGLYVKGGWMYENMLNIEITNVRTTFGIFFFRREINVDTW